MYPGTKKPPPHHGPQDSQIPPISQTPPLKALYLLVGHLTMSQYTPPLGKSKHDNTFFNQNTTTSTPIKPHGPQSSTLNKDVITSEGLPIPETQNLYICDSNGKHIAQHKLSPPHSHILNIPGANTKHIIQALRINLSKDPLNKRKRDIQNVIIQVGTLNFTLYIPNVLYARNTTQTLITLIHQNFINAALFIFSPIPPQHMTPMQNKHLLRYIAALKQLAADDNWSYKFTLIKQDLRGDYRTTPDEQIHKAATNNNNSTPITPPLNHNKTLNVNFNKERTAHFIETICHHIINKDRQEEELEWIKQWEPLDNATSPTHARL